MSATGAPRCSVCGEAHSGREPHIWAKPAKQAKTEAPGRHRSDDRKVGKAPVPTSVSTVGTRRGDRHKPGYQRNLMQARRAIAAGRAERFPRA